MCIVWPIFVLQGANQSLKTENITATMYSFYNNGRLFTSHSSIGGQKVSPKTCQKYKMRAVADEIQYPSSMTAITYKFRFVAHCRQYLDATDTRQGRERWIINVQVLQVCNLNRIGNIASAFFPFAITYKFVVQ